MKNILWLILVVGILIAIAALIGAPSQENFEGDTTAEINQQLDSLDLGDLETEFNEIDSALEQL